MFRLRLLLLCAASAGAVNFALQDGEERCISELLMPKALLTGEWRVTVAPPPAPKDGAAGSPSPPPPPPPPATPALALNTTMRVLSPSGESLFESTLAAGHFSVTAAENGEHRVCIKADAGAVRASLIAKAAVEVADHALAARPEHVAAVSA